MRTRLWILFVLIGFNTTSQDIQPIKKIEPELEFENIWVKKISDSPEQSTFLIWIKHEVPLHKHLEHTELIYVISGKGEMTLNDEKLVIKKGDFFTIQKNTIHGLKVLSSTPVKVLSIQSPQFDGSDRILIEG